MFSLATTMPMKGYGYIAHPETTASSTGERRSVKMLLESLRLLGRCVDPSVLLSLLVLTSLVTMVMRRNRLALALQVGAAAIVLVFGVFPGGTWLALPLEARFAPVRDPPSDIAGIIVLGGAQRLAIS